MSHQATDLSLHPDTEGQSPSSPVYSDTESHAVSSGENQDPAPTIHCLDPGCTKAFTKFYLLKAHIDRFHPDIEKRFPCTVPNCPQGNRCYGSLCDLERHYNCVHHPNPPLYPHLACGRLFKRSDHLKAHMEVCRYRDPSQTHSNTTQSTPLDPMLDGTMATASSSRNSPRPSGYPSSGSGMRLGSQAYLAAQPSPGTEHGSSYASSNIGQDEYNIPYRNRVQTPTQMEISSGSNDSHGVAQPHAQYASDPYASQQPSLYDTSNATTTNSQTASAFPPGNLEPATLAAESSPQTNTEWMHTRYPQAGSALTPGQMSFEQLILHGWDVSDDDVAAIEEYGFTAWWVSKNSKPHRHS